MPLVSGDTSSVDPVVFICSHARLGGSEQYLEWLLAAIEPEWVLAVVSLEDGPLPERSRELGHPTVVISTGNRRFDVVRSAWQLRALLRGKGARVVHANGVKAAAVAAIATLGTGVSVIWVKFDYSRDGLASSLLALRCNQVVGVSEAVTRAFGPRFRKKVSVVYTGIPSFDVDQAVGRALVLGQFEAPNPEHVVTLVGRLDPDKGHTELIEIAPAVLARRPHTGFLFVGGLEPLATDYGRQLLRRVDELGLRGRVRFLAHRGDIKAFMAGSDLLAHVSVLVHGVRDTEGFPLVALESMLAGTPVVGYANGGLRELVGDCGRLVTRGDRGALVDVIVGLLRDDSLRANLSACGRERVREHFLLDANLEAMKLRYRVAVGARASSTR